VFGGAADKGAKASDLQLLCTGAAGKLTWRHLGGSIGDDASSRGLLDGWPHPRGAHAVEVLDGRLYVLGGYGGGEVRVHWSAG
jgi:hypothetical protein